MNNISQFPPDKFLSLLGELRHTPAAYDAHPTLIIGIGEQARLVLLSLKKQLLGVGGGSLPRKVRFLWLGSEDSQGNLDFMHYEKILLNPDYEKADRTIDLRNDAYANLRWWFSNKLERGNGRFSLYWIRYFERKDELIDAFRHANQELTMGSDRRYQVFFVANLLEPVSAILVDLAFLLRKMFPNQIQFLVPFLLLNNVGDTEPRSEQKAGVIAALRELERFVSGSPQPLPSLIDPGLTRGFLAPPNLFDHFFLLDHPRSHVLLPDILYALLDTNVAEKFKQTIIQAGSGSIDRRESFHFSAPTVFTYLFPLAELRQACASRLIDDVLFAESAYGLPSRGLYSLPTKEEKSPDDFVSLARSFLRDEQRRWGDASYPFDLIANASERRRIPISGASPVSDLKMQFQVRLANFLNDTMCQSQNRDFIQAGGVIGWASDFLGALKSVLSDAGFFLKAQQNDPVARDLSVQLDDLRRAVDSWVQELSKWQNALRDIHQRTRSMVKRDNDELKLLQQPAEARRVYFGRASGDDQGFESPYYQDFLSGTNGQQAWRKLRERIGWYWRVDSDPRKTRLFWMIFGSEHNLQNWPKVLMDYSPDNKETALERLTELGGYFTREIAFDESITGLLTEISSGDVVQPFKKPEFLAEVNWVPDASRVSDYYLVGSDTDQLRTWTGKNGLMFLHNNVVQSRDVTRIIHLVIERNLPRGASERLKYFESSYSADPGLYVFLEEQAAAKVEKKLRKGERLYPLHSRFVRLMGNSDAFEIAMRCVFYDWIRKEDNQYRKSWFIVLPENAGQKHRILLEDETLREYSTPSPDNLEGALAMFLVIMPVLSINNAHDLHRPSGRFDRTLKLLKDALDKQKDETAQLPPEARVNRRKELEERNQKWLENNDDPFFQSLGVYQQQYLLEREFGYY